MYSLHVAVTLVRHPIADDALAGLRDTATDASRFRLLAHRLTLIVAIEATRDLPTTPGRVQTPLEETDAHRLTHDLVVVPVLRAGLGMVAAVLDLLPSARVGHVGLARDERTAVATCYFSRLPAIGPDTRVLIVDPMLATGGSAIEALTAVYGAGARDVRLLSVVAAPEGLEAVTRAFPSVAIFTAAIDRALDARKFIVPGLGDFGDRLHGT